MSKYGPQERLRERREAREQLEAFAEESKWTPDMSRPTEEDRNTAHVTLTGVVAQRVVRDVETQLIVEFAVMYCETQPDGQTAEILCIDSCNHGTVHRHVNGDHGSEPQVIREITTQDDVQDGYWEAVAEVYDRVNWEVPGHGQ